MKLHNTSDGQSEVLLSVSELLQLIYPAGDIHAGFYGAPRVQTSVRTSFLTELSGGEGFVPDFSVHGYVDRPETAPSLSFSVETLSYRIGLSGTIDGVLQRDGKPPILYLILPSGGYDAGGKFRARSRATLRVLAALYLEGAGGDSAELCFVTALSTGRLLYEYESATLYGLRAALSELIEGVLQTTDFLVHHRTHTVPKSGDVPFPFPKLRDGQEELIRSVYRAVRKGKRLFAEAPTGIGKTMSVLYPSVKALGKGHVDKIFYLTAKASTSREAFNAAGKLFHAGARLRTCVITAKEQMCLSEKKDGAVSSCNPFDCPYADGYYERAPAAIAALLGQRNGYTRETILAVAKEFRVCPYELSLDLSEKCDIVICDYNYIFDPTVYFRRYFGEDRTCDGKYVFLIDEGHNLADRAREMYSVSLYRSRIVRVLDMIPEEQIVLRATLNRMIDGFESLKALCADTLSKDSCGVESGFYMSKEAPRFLDDLLEKTAASLREELRTAKGLPYGNLLSDLSAEIRTYRLLRGYYNERFLTMVRVRGGDVETRIFCLDPSEVLDECLSRAHAAVIFSATLTPLDYFTELLGGGRTAEHLSLPSPFPRENLCVAVCDSISTRFENRANTYRSISSSIAATVSQKRGNYIVYFPSYAYLEEVAKAFSSRYPKVELILQRRGMGHAEREAFLESFKDDGRLNSMVFLKGYQWPFDVRKVPEGSSIVDLLVHKETSEKGRRVFLDFRSNPQNLDFDALSVEAKDYLERSGALFGTPLERLEKMNPGAISLYRDHNIDLAEEPLEIAVCSQHNNGGLAGDIWYESPNLKHLFPIGEVNGSHGVTRPGGSALNAGQAEDPGSDCGAHIGAHDHIDGLAQRHQSGVDKAHHHHRGGGGGLDHRRDSQAGEKARRFAGGQPAQHGFQSLTGAALQRAAHLVHAEEEKAQTADQRQNIKKVQETRSFLKFAFVCLLRSAAAR